MSNYIRYSIQAFYNLIKSLNVFIIFIQCELKPKQKLLLYASKKYIKKTLYKAGVKFISIHQIKKGIKGKPFNQNPWMDITGPKWNRPTGVQSQSNKLQATSAAIVTSLKCFKAFITFVKRLSNEGAARSFHLRDYCRFRVNKRAYTLQ